MSAAQLEGPAPAMLTVQIRSGCVIGVDDGGSLEVDLASAVDEYGLPYVPRYRLAARLRDAALTVLTHAGADDEAVRTASELFGASGIGDRRRRAVTVGHARLPRATQAAVVAAVTASEELNPGSRLLREAVRSAYTVRKVSTARDERGAPVRGTLRDAEAVIPGVVLEADLTWAPGRPTAAQVAFLARTVLALTQIGHGETDFWGRVDCSLDGDRAATAALAFGEIR